jgi:hypothetical protein
LLTCTNAINPSVTKGTMTAAVAPMYAPMAALMLDTIATVEFRHVQQLQTDHLLEISKLAQITKNCRATP